MPIITKPAQIQKNVSTSITLNKSTLASNSVVASDAYFSDSSNWNQVIINYQSPVGNQKESLVFDASLSSPTASFLVSLKARDTFEVQDIVITDFDKGFLKIERADLVTADFDISFGGGSGGGGASAISWNILGSNLSAFGSGGLNSSGTGWGPANNAITDISQSSNSSDWTYIFNLSLGATKECSFGTTNSTGIASGYANVDYGFHIQGGGNVDISIQGNYAAVGSVTSVGSGNHEFKVVYTQSDYIVKFYVNSVLVHTQAPSNSYFTTNPDSYPMFAFYNSTAQGVSLLSSLKS